jgi:hypothetical protein
MLRLKQMIRTKVFFISVFLLVGVTPLSPTYAAGEENMVTGLEIVAGAEPGDVLVRWVAPQEATGLTSYYVQLFESGGVPSEVDDDYSVAGINQTSMTFTYDPESEGGISIGKSYLVTVKSQYTNTYYETRTTVPFTVYGAPSQPKSLSALRIGEGQVNLTWVEPDDNGGTPITSYQIQCDPDCPDGTNLILEGANLATSLSILNLDPSQTYKFTVQAQNAKYLSEASSESEIKAFAAPGQPGNVSAAAGIESVKVSWVKSSPSSSVTAYFVEILDASDLTEVVATEEVSGAQSSATVSQLQSGTEFKARVTPFIGSVNGDSNITASTFTPKSPTVASQPRVPTAVGSDRAVTVSWTAPTTNGGRSISIYRVTSAPGNKSCTSTKTSCKITGLANGTGYTFTVKAINSVGSSSSSVATKSVSPFSTISGIKWVAKSKGKSVKATFKPINGAKTYKYSTTGATKKSGTCKVKGKKSKAKVECKISVKKGNTSIVISAFTKANTDLAKVTKSVKAK